uniref:Fatty acid desaturase 2 n=1 Tax=Hucho hucho TaxID=62062 RepID=A0A4W5M1V1_9TELE
MGGGGQQTESGEPAKGGGVGPDGGLGGSAVYTWEEVQRHSHRGDQWLVIDRKVYNITQWAKRHPGGIRVISHFAGEDATVSSLTMEVVDEMFCAIPRLLKIFNAIQHSFHGLQLLLNASKPKCMLFNRSLPAPARLTNITTLDVLLCKIHLTPCLCLLQYGIKKLKYMPYHHQHQYFFLIGPPLIVPVFFNIQIFRTMFSQRDWVDLAWSISFYLRFFCCYYPFFGFFGSIALISFVRFLESHWFVWVTQMSHLPMEMDHERHQDWLTMQLSATCNIEQSTFNDWFSGHLNFQIEHHLFPTMPRHNYHLVAPLVRTLCEKHGVPYQVKTLQKGMTDVVRSLKKSGDLWLDAYLHK